MLLLQMIYRGLMTINKSFVKDKRFNSYPFIDKPWLVIVTISLYLLIVLKVGPKFMENRKPFQIDGLVKLYNIIQIVLNGFIFYEAVKYSYMRNDFPSFCMKYDPNDMRPLTMKLVRPAVLYYISKYLDIFDTIFFLLRKKYNQISFLHVYHHSIMILAVYLYCTFMFSSHFSMVGILNCFVHVCMYTYYLVSSIKVNINLEPWKRILTQIQLLQFAFLALHFGLPLFNNWCKLPLYWLLLAFVQNTFMIVLFSNFYYQTYILKDRKKKKSIHTHCIQKIS